MNFFKFRVGDVIYDACTTRWTVTEMIRDNNRNYYFITNTAGRRIFASEESLFAESNIRSAQYARTLVLEPICSRDKYGRTRGCAYVPAGTIIKRRNGCP